MWLCKKYLTVERRYLYSDFVRAVAPQWYPTAKPDAVKYVEKSNIARPSHRITPLCLKLSTNLRRFPLPTLSSKCRILTKWILKNLGRNLKAYKWHTTHSVFLPYSKGPIHIGRHLATVRQNSTQSFLTCWVAPFKNLWTVSAAGAWPRLSGSALASVTPTHQNWVC